MCELIQPPPSLGTNSTTVLIHKLCMQHGYLLIDCQKVYVHVRMYLFIDCMYICTSEREGQIYSVADCTPR